MQIGEIGSVFSDVARVDYSPKRRTEGTYKYLNRSADEHAGRMRALIEKWYGAFPEEGRREVQRRLQLGGSRGFESAFHELFLNALVNALGCRGAVHPSVSGTVKRPDFSVHSQDHGDFYLEAVLATNQSDAAVGAKQREGTLLDGLDDVDTPEYFVGVEVSTTSEKPGSAKRLRRFVVEKFQALVRVDVEHALDARGIDGLPRFIYEDEGWTIELTAFPKSGAAESGEARAIGVEVTGVHRIDSVIPLRNALERKAGRYGDLGKPYIIALNALDMFAGDISIEEALFGTEVMVENNIQSELRHNPDGLWYDKTGPRYSRVSGVLFTRKVRSYNMLNGAEARLYLNSEAEHPYSGELTQLPRAEGVGTRYLKLAGVSLEELLGVGKHWRD